MVRPMKKILIVTTVGGFLPQFEMNDVKLLMEQGYEIHYASNFQNPVYQLDREALEAKGLKLHPIDIQKSPAKIGRNLKALFQLCTILREEDVSVVHCHNPMGGVLGRIAATCLPKHKRPYVIYTAHGFHFYRGAPFFNWMFFYPTERLLAGCTDCLITINHEDAQRAEKF